MNVDDFWPRHLTVEEMRHRDRERYAEERARKVLIEGVAGRVYQVVLHPELFRTTHVMNREQIHTAPPHMLRAMTDSLAQRLVVELERGVYQHTKETINREVDTWEQEVPWQTEVAVTVPNGWWRRLFRLPRRIIWQTARGTVKARGRVTVSATQSFAFPDLDPGYYPAAFGEPIEHVRFDWTPTPHLDAHATYAAPGGGTVTEAGSFPAALGGLPWGDDPREGL